MNKKYLMILGFAFLLGGQTALAAVNPSAGKAKFDTFCVTCHGLKGLGDGAAAAAMNPKPRNLQVTKKTNDELKKIIKEGGAASGLSAGMPAWGGSLSDGDIENVIAYIRTLNKK